MELCLHAPCVLALYDLRQRSDVVSCGATNLHMPFIIDPPLRLNILHIEHKPTCLCMSNETGEENGRQYLWRVLSSTYVSEEHIASIFRVEEYAEQETSLKAKLCLPPALTLVSCSAYYSTLKMEAICSSEASVDFQRTTRCYIPEDSILYNHRCENLKSYAPLPLFWKRLPQCHAWIRLDNRNLLLLHASVKFQNFWWICDICRFYNHENINQLG
jgi:hypothetical protein